MVNPDKHSNLDRGLDVESPTANNLRIKLDEQAGLFSGHIGELPPDVDQAFWEANRAVLEAMRAHERTNGTTEPHEDTQSQG